MRVLAICATAGRHTLLERSIGMFLQQVGAEVGEGDHAVQPIYELLIYNNSDVPLDFDKDLKLDEEGSHKYMRIRLVNQHLDQQTGETYTNLGAIYRDALKEIEWEEPDLITFWDDDDLFLRNHLLEGLRGYLRGKARDSKIAAYKPAKSYYRHPGGIQLMSNTLEPSIFVEYDHINKHGFSPTTTDQHLQWVNPLVYENRIYVDETGAPTLIYNWGDQTPTFKTSGNAGNPENFNNYRKFSQDHGDKIITPQKREQLQPYYDLVYG